MGLTSTIARGLDLPHGPGEPSGDLGEDEDGHAIADAALGDELTQPHDDGGTGGHREHHDDDEEDVLVIDDGQLTGLEQRARNSHGDECSGLQNAQHQREVAGVLGDLVLPGCTLLLQRLELGNDDRQQLQDDRRRDVGHDSQREDRQLQQRTTGEHVDHRVQAGSATGAGLRLAGVDVCHVDIGYGEHRPQSENSQDANREEDLLA